MVDKKGKIINWNDLNINEKEALLMYQADRNPDEIKQTTGVCWNKLERLVKMVQKKEK